MEFKITHEYNKSFVLVLPEAFGKYTPFDSIVATINEHINNHYLLKGYENLEVYHDCDKLCFKVILHNLNLRIPDNFEQEVVS
jgi:hypothetical protein